jgi:hypothetical protein
MSKRCFACARPLSDRRTDFPTVLTEDGAQRVFVGNDCFAKVLEARGDGYQPPLGGPRLFADIHAPDAVLAAAGVTIRRGGR